MVSAFDDSPTGAVARAAGADQVFAKPLDYDALSAELSTRLSG